MLYLMTMLLCACQNTPANDCAWANEVLPITASSEFKVLGVDRLMLLNVRDKKAQEDIIIAASNNRDILTKDTATQILKADEAWEMNCQK